MTDARFPTRIVATHDYDLAVHADEVIVMEQGKIGARGKWSDLIERANNYKEGSEDEVARCVKNYLKSLDEERKHKDSEEEYDQPNPKKAPKNKSLKRSLGGEEGQPPVDTPEDDEEFSKIDADDNSDQD